jgi:hypothetical protein
MDGLHVAEGLSTPLLRTMKTLFMPALLLMELMVAGHVGPFLEHVLQMAVRMGWAMTEALSFSSEAALLVP